MKNYFNQYEASNHLVLMTAMLSNKNLLDGNSITPQERKMLEKVMELVGKFSESVFERLGDGYKRSLKNKAQTNTLRLVSRNITNKFDTAMEDCIDNETLHAIIDQTADIDCMGCERTDCKNCGIYKIKSYLHYDGKCDKTELCPFRKDQADMPEINFEEF